MTITAIACAQFEDGRNYISPSPNSAAFLRYSTTPVNNYTGVAAISAPLHTLHARGFTIPLVLSYHSSGIKVQDIASNVGLGWSLTANSLVSRIVRGLPDESITGYFGGDMGNKLDQPLTTETLVNVSTGISDSEPDLFYYNLNGITGKFVFNKEKKPIMLSNDGIRILNSPFKKELGVDEWIFCDLQGNKFFLGSDNSSIENTQTIISGENNNVTLNYTSSWFINKIVLLNETETINYAYDLGAEIRFKQYRSRRKFMNKITTSFNREIFFLGIRLREFSVDNQVEVMNKSTWNDNIEDIISEPKYLKSITTSNQSAYFYYGLNTREDLINGLVLNRIQIKNQDQEIIQDFRLNYKYVNAESDKEQNLLLTDQTITRFMQIYTSGFDPNHLYYNRVGSLVDLKSQIDILTDAEYYAKYCFLAGAYPVLQTPVAQDLKRLFLTDIVSYSRDGSSNIPLFRFIYNEQKLPKRTSVKIDHWGYYNNNSLYSQFPVEVNETYAYKLPNETNCQAGILKKIIYSTGSYKEFNYELNDYKNPSNSAIEAGAGLRVKSIVNVPGYNSAPMISRYGYKKDGVSTGRLLISKPVYISYIDHSENQIFAPSINFQPAGMPQYNVTQMRGDMVSPIPLGQSIITSVISSLPNLLNGGSSTTVRYSPYIMETTTSFNSIFDLDGTAVGYDEVTIENGDEGKTVCKFTNAVDYPDYSNQIRVNSSFISLNRISPNLSPFTPVTSYAFARGLPKEVITYNNKDEVVKKEMYTYNFNSVADSVKGFRCAIGKINTTNGIFNSYSTAYYNIGYYNMISKPILLTKITQENYYGSSTAPLVQIKTFNYDANCPALLTKEQINNSDGGEFVTDYKYVFHYSQIGNYNTAEASAAQWLYNNNAYGILLDRVRKNGNTIVDHSLTGFESFTNSNKTQVYKRSSYEGRENRLDTLFTFNYNEFGNITQKNINHGSASTVIYDKKNIHPVLEVKNSKVTEIYLEDFENNQNAVNGIANSGSKFLSGDYSCSFNPTMGNDHKISYWYLENGQWNCSGWNKYSGPGMQLTLGEAIDDVIIIPSSAQSNYLTYGPVGLKSAVDNNSKAKFYEYDRFNRLTTIKDYNKDIIKYYKYNDVSNYVGDIFLNDEQTATFTKNNCESGSASDPVIYKIPEGKHFSYLSKAEANSKANVDLSENGQAYANRNGNCYQSAQYYLNYQTDPYFQFADCTVTKSFQDHKNATVMLRITYDTYYGGQPTEIYTFVNVDQNSLYGMGYFEVHAASYCMIEIVDIIFN